MVRITGGKLRGRSINSAETVELRPTTSFFREWIFNVLNNIIELSGTHVLDLFSGTGIISYEFLSRGASSAVSVEKDGRLVSLIKSNKIAEDIKAPDVIHSECSMFLKNLIAKDSASQFNIIFMDAPYEKTSLTDDILELIFTNSGKFSEELIIIVETDKDKVLKIGEGFVIIKSKSSGTTKMSVIGRSD
ncbi:MAG: hypothetical protein A2Y39_03960 [Candidatus Delongbacteria bacterium GWF2_40_14]|nr:MAG: hypothetical protein A2Y39_03960 [Candidatus Delongbacteria bacterium GWF2_40_14]